MNIKANILVAKKCCLVLLLGYCIVGQACNGSAKNVVDQWKKRVDQQLPVGSQDSKVIDFLDRNHISHSTYEVATTMEEEKLFGAHGRITAIIRDVKRTPISHVDIRLLFLFNQNNGMVTYQISEVVTSF